MKMDTVPTEPFKKCIILSINWQLLKPTQRSGNRLYWFFDSYMLFCRNIPLLMPFLNINSKQNLGLGIITITRLSDLNWTIVTFIFFNLVRFPSEGHFPHFLRSDALWLHDETCLSRRSGRHLLGHGCSSNRREIPLLLQVCLHTFS